MTPFTDPLAHLELADVGGQAVVVKLLVAAVLDCNLYLVAANIVLPPNLVEAIESIAE